MPRILLVDDETVFLCLLTKLLTARGYDVTPAKSGEEALQLLQTEPFDLMISDIKMLPINGMELLRKAKDSYAEMSIIMLTADETIDTALEAMKQGAFDYLTKPFQLNEMILTVRRALEYHDAITENKTLRARLKYREHVETLKGIVTESPGMLNVCDKIERIAPSDTTVLICGERGSGKKLVARDLHRYSLRKNGPFLSVNCSARPGSKIEGELFGHARSTLPEAPAFKKGLFEAACGGTLFIEKIDAMPLDVQVRLLETLESGRIRKVGGGDPIRVDVRILAASNENLESLVEQGKFHKNLYGRLNVIRIDIPPLRSRPEDILPLIDQTLRRNPSTNARAPVLDIEAEAILENYAWPGNVRELEEVVRHALSSTRGNRITKRSLPAGIVAATKKLMRSENLLRHRERLKGRSLRAFLHRKEKELLQRVREHLDEDEPAEPIVEQGVEKKACFITEHQVELVPERKVLYFPRPRPGEL